MGTICVWFGIMRWNNEPACCAKEPCGTFAKRELWFGGLKRRNFACGIAEGKTISKWGYAIVKWILTVYQIGFWSFRLHSFVAGEFKDEPHWYSDYLTNWNDTIVLLYFVLSSICVLAHCYTGKWDEKYLDEPAPWYYYFVQLLHEIAAIQSTMVTFLYWAFINDPARRSAPGNVHGHAMVMVVTFIDFLVTGLPMRSLHIIYLWATVWLYGLNTFIAYNVDRDRDNVYPFLNWHDGKGPDFPLGTIPTLLIFSFVAYTIVYYCYYGIYRLKVFLADHAVKDWVQRNRARKQDLEQAKATVEVPAAEKPTAEKPTEKATAEKPVQKQADEEEEDAAQPESDAQG